jgi:uncharacterized protein (DUF934 family)
MMLIDDTGFIPDPWLRPAPEMPLPSDVPLILTLDRLKAAGDEPVAQKLGLQKLGLQVPNNTRLAELLPLLPRLALISIEFPASGDGRGFSLGKALRDAGYRGELRASGRLIADQYAHARGCGFDSVEVPDDLAARQPEAHWKAAANSLSLSYQRGYRRGCNILDQRRQARAAAAAAVGVE